MKGLLITIGALLVLLITGVFVADPWLERRIRRTLEQAVAQYSDGTGRLQIGHLDAALLRRTITASDIVIYRDTAEVLHIRQADLFGLRLQPDLMRGIEGLCKQITLGGLRYTLPGGEQTFTAETLVLKAATDRPTGGFLDVRQIAFGPRYTKAQYAARADSYPDWTQIRAERFSCDGLDLSRLQSDTLIRIDHALLQHTVIESYKDRNGIQPPRPKPLFFELLQRLPFRFQMQAMKWEGVDVTYEETAPGATAAGRITFNDIDVNFRGLTNIPTPGRTYNELELSGRLLGLGELNARLQLPIDTLTDRFHIVGSLGPMALSPLNAIVEPLARLRIDSGRLQGLSFEIEGSRTQANSTVQFLYNNLHVTLLQKRSGRLAARPGLSRIVNKWVIQSSNTAGIEMRTTQATAQRDPYRSPFNYLWRSLSPALEQTVGLR